MSLHSPSTPEYPSTPTTGGSEFTTPITSKKRGKFQMTPLPTPTYTKDEQKQTLMQKNTLEAELEALNSHYKILVNQQKDVRDKNVKESELYLLKASIFSQSREKYNENIKKIQDSYFETLHSIHNLESQCYLFERQIQEEEVKRRIIVNENHQLNELFDFSSFTIEMPTVHTYQSFSEEILQKGSLSLTNNSDINLNFSQENTILLSQISKIRSDLSHIDIIKPPAKVQAEASLEYAKSLETQWQVRGFGIPFLRQEIQRLQKNVLDSELLTKNSEQTNQNLQAKLSKYQINSTDFDKCDDTLLDNRFRDTLTQIKNKTTEFSYHLSDMNKEIERLSIKIQESSEQIDKIDEEMEEFSPFSKSINSFNLSTNNYKSNDINKNKNNEEESFNDNQDEQYWYEQKQKLESEINVLKKSIHHFKSKERRFEARAKEDICSLYEKLSQNKLIISQQIAVDEISNSPFNKGITSLIQRIDHSIEELRSSLTE